MKKDEVMKQSVLYGVIGLLVGVLLTVFVAAVSVNTNNQTMMKMMGMNTNSMMSGSSMSMEDMTNELKNKSGDEFDKVFLEQMIIHHQGAIDMANIVLQKSSRPELRKLAEEIITAQTKEINQMKQWQMQWGYTTSSSMDNSMGGMHH